MLEITHNEEGHHVTLCAKFDAACRHELLKLCAFLHHGKDVVMDFRKTDIIDLAGLGLLLLLAEDLAGKSANLVLHNCTPKIAAVLHSLNVAEYAPNILY